MSKRIYLILKYWAAWLLMFFLGRLFFLYVTRAEGKQASFHQHWESLLYGLRMDASMSTYITLPVILLLLANLVSKKFNPFAALRWYTGILIVLCALIFTIDAQSFKFWGHRIDASILNYIKDPREAAASTAHFPLIKWTVLLVAAIVVMIRLNNAFLKRNLPLGKPKTPWRSYAALLILLGASIIPIRGGIQLAPLNQSSVYFSKNNYANQAALNPVWNFLFSIKRSREVTTNPYIAMPDDEAEKIAKGLLRSAYTGTIDSIRKRNVILLVWESFTSKVVDTFFNGIEVTPNFNRLKNEGLWFSNVYATGDRTDKGIVGILSGYPAQPISSIVKNPGKTRSLPQLGKALQSAGYHNVFFYGGEMEFANIKSYLLEGGFHELVDVNIFDRKSRNSKWGAHDGIVKDSFQTALNKLPEPFFATWLTLSSHEPFETPQAKVIKGEETVPAFLNSLHYTDKVVGDFVSFCKKMPWWNNTMLVIVADHGHRYPPSADEFDNFHIPALILGGNITNAHYTHVVSQTGLPSTILRMNGLSDSAFNFSRNWFGLSSIPWAFFSFNNGFGYTKKDSALVYDNVGSQIRQGKRNYSNGMLKEGRALQQFFFNDFLKR